MPQLNFVKEKLKSGKSVIGTWTIINSPITVEIAAQAGLDFQILDMEHGVFDVGTLDACIRSCESAGASPLVRVPSVQPTIIQTCLDLGAHGILAPQIRDFLHAQEFLQATQFAPAGQRGFNPFTRAGNYYGALGPSAIKLEDSFGLRGILIENQSAFEQLDKILELSSLDVVYLGVYDMSVALGCKGNLSHPSITSFVQSAVSRIRRAGKAAGMMVKDAGEIKHNLSLGVQFFVYGVDTFVFYRSILAGVNEFRGELSKHENESF